MFALNCLRDLMFAIVYNRRKKHAEEANSFIKASSRLLLVVVVLPLKGLPETVSCFQLHLSLSDTLVSGARGCSIRARSPVRRRFLARVRGTLGRPN